MAQNALTIIETPAGIVNAQLMRRWVSFVDASPKTIATYTRSILRFADYLASVDCTDPTRETIIAYRDALKADHKPATVNAYMCAVRLFFQWTASEGIYPNVAEHIKGAKSDRTHKKDYLTSGQAKDVLDQIDRTDVAGLRDYAMTALMMTTGLRTVSIAAANIEDLRTLGDAVVLYYRGKGHEEKAEFVKVAPQAESAIRAYLKARGQANGSEPLFASASNLHKGGRMHTGSISRIVKARLRDAGFDSDRLTAHSLRHTAATLSILNGGTIEETQQMLGHADISTTMIYAHTLDRVNSKTEARIADAIFA